MDVEKVTAQFLRKLPDAQIVSLDYPKPETN